MKTDIQGIKDGAKAAIIVGNTLAAIIGVLSYGGRVIVPMAFDAPGSENDIMLQIFARAIWYLPTACLLTIPLSWWLYHRSRLSSAQIVSISPILVVVLCIAIITIISLF